MFEHLNTRTRQLVIKLIKGETVPIGGETVGPLKDDELLLLYTIVAHLPDLSGSTGKVLADKVIELFENAEIPGEIGESDVSETYSNKWILRRVRACSFRGLAPAGKEWEFEFDGKSHLIYGPNGCGKSSLLGAIAWCLTGKIFRDDQPPSAPEDVAVYTTAEKAKKKGERPDALTLIDESGSSTVAEKEYWVEVQLISKLQDGDLKEQWLKRHSHDGLSKSEDGSSWSSITSINEVSISELDAELSILTPARVPYIRFGQDQDMTHLFSQVVGLDDMEEIVQLAAKAGRASKTEANKIERDILKEKEKINEYVDIVNQKSNSEVKSLSTFKSAMGKTRTCRCNVNMSPLLQR